MSRERHGKEPLAPLPQATKDKPNRRSTGLPVISSLRAGDLRLLGCLIELFGSAHRVDAGMTKAATRLVALLAGWLRPVSQPDPILSDEPHELIELARNTKMMGMLRAGSASLGLLLPPQMASEVEQAQAHILQMNLRIFAMVSRLAAIMDRQGYPYFIAKGPLRSEQVYGAADVRVSRDLDLFVLKEHYWPTAALLEQQLGYRCLVAPDDRWWHEFLGESPFQPRDGTGMTIDLHNQLQQPGGPYPSNAEKFFERSVARPVGRSIAYILSPDDALMLTAINFGKALRGGEPWIGYAHELLYSLQGQHPSAEQRLRVLAKEHQLSRLFDEFLWCAKTVFDVDGAELTQQSAFEREQLLLSSCGLKPLGLFGRTRASWRWAEGSGSQRFQRLTAALSKEMRSRIARRNSVMLSVDGQ